MKWVYQQKMLPSSIALRDWDSLLPLLKHGWKAAGYECVANLKDLKQLIATEEAQLWVLYVDESRTFGLVVTEVVQYPKCFMLRITYAVAVGGAKPNWVEVVKRIETYARSIGASGVELIGRMGWLKVLKELNYDESCFMRKEF